MKIRILSVLILLIFITGCNGTFEIGLEPSGASASNLTATSTTASLPVDASVTPATSIPESQPTADIPLESNIATGTPSMQFVDIYLIAIDDQGQSGIPVGCGDSAVPVQVQIQPTQGVLKAALEALLSIKQQYYGESGLYNALYQADWQVERVNIADGIAKVYLSGTLMLGGECDNPRVQAQLEQTVLQFSTVTRADIYINGKFLADAISLKGQ